jgi:hypothetical protein
MQDRRQSPREKVFYGAVAEINERGSTMDCVEFGDAAHLPEEMNLSVARKGRSFLARLIWRQANKVGLAFRIMTSDTYVSDLDERVRRSEIKKRQLQRRIKELLGQS